MGKQKNPSSYHLFQKVRDERASDFVVGADAEDWMDDGRDIFDDDEEEQFQEDGKSKKSHKKKMAKFASGSGNIAAMILKQAKNKSKSKTQGRNSVSIPGIRTVYSSERYQDARG